MAFSYTNSKDRTYILHSRVTTLRNGSKQTIYFFASDEKEGALNEVPEGYEVSESKNGLPPACRFFDHPQTSRGLFLS